ncbi:MAG: amino acid ABC transporter permease [Cardiobacteriaceae bacterium]|nr:amino acid ABC transporter permease [Cardiobacteriaceae bacterium]
MDYEYIWAHIPHFYRALKITLELSFWAILGSFFWGLCCALILYYRLWGQKIIQFYIELSRNTPLLIQLFFLYYGLPKIGIKWDGYTCSLIALIFLGGSYMAEALRAGLNQIQKSQIESALALGLNGRQILLKIIFPQAGLIALPALIANVLFLIKETSVVSAVSVAELLFVTRELISLDYLTNEALFLLFLSYLVVLLPLVLLAKIIEKRMRSVQYGI